MHTASDSDDCCVSHQSVVSDENKSASDWEAWWCRVSTLPLNAPSVWWFIDRLHIIGGRFLTVPCRSIQWWKFLGITVAVFCSRLCAGCFSATPQPLRPSAASQPHCSREQNSWRWVGETGAAWQSQTQKLQLCRWRENACGNTEREDLATWWRCIAWINMTRDVMWGGRAPASG